MPVATLFQSLPDKFRLQRRGLFEPAPIERQVKTAGRGAGLPRGPGRGMMPLIAVGGAVGAGVALVRARSLRWGATEDELKAVLPGDELVSRPQLMATRAVTTHAAADVVWPWIAQLGQERGGFYSYDFLENLIGCGIRSAERVVADWQDVEVGDSVHLHPEVSLLVAAVEPGRALVLRGGVPIGGMPPPYDFTWAFVLRERPDGTTRLVVRERYRYLRWWARLLVEPVELISFVMSRRMLRGIKQRAERSMGARDGKP